MKERIFSISGNNKGLACPFKPILCQEGYCKGCQIYLDWQEREEIVLMCAWCGRLMNRKPNPGRPVVSHGICPECKLMYFPKTGAGLLKLQTNIFELCRGRYSNLTQLAQVMGISISQIYRVREGQRPINQKFIVGVTKAFPEYKLDELFYVSPRPKPE